MRLCADAARPDTRTVPEALAMVTSSRFVGRVSPLQFTASNQLSVPAPPSQVFVVVQPFPVQLNVPPPVLMRLGPLTLAAWTVRFLAFVVIGCVIVSAPVVSIIAV